MRDDADMFCPRLKMEIPNGREIRAITRQCGVLFSLTVTSHGLT